MFHLKSKVFNNVERPLKAQSSIQAQRLSTMLGNLKAQLVPSTVCGGFWKPVRCIFVCMCVPYERERDKDADTDVCV